MDKITICNMALRLLGEPSIATLDIDNNKDPTSKKSIRNCNLFFDCSLDLIIKSYRWKFAIKRATLVRDTVNPEFEWAYQYHLPHDCLRVLEMHCYDIPWEIEGRHLLTDYGEAKIKYLKEITNLGEMDVYAVKALSYELAASMAVSLRGAKGPPEADRLKKTLIQQIIPEARQNHSLESNKHDVYRENAGEWVRSRFRGRDFHSRVIAAPVI